MRRSELVVLLLIEAEDDATALDEDRPANQVWVLHHQIDRFLLRFRQRPLFEHRAPRAHEVEKSIGLDVALEKLACGRFLVDIELLHVHACCVQKTSGIFAGRSRRLPVEGWLRHAGRILEMLAVVLLSGGLDSYTAGAIARAGGFDLCALTVAYGQRHAREIESARAVARSLGAVRHLELDIDLRKIGGSSLTSDVAVPHDRRLDGTDIPSTYVPARNTILLSLALGVAEVLGATDIVLGVNALD